MSEKLPRQHILIKAGSIINYGHSLADGSIENREYVLEEDIAVWPSDGPKVSRKYLVLSVSV